jgi:hypothetical protein
MVPGPLSQPWTVLTSRVGTPRLPSSRSSNRITAHGVQGMAKKSAPKSAKPGAKPAKPKAERIRELTDEELGSATGGLTVKQTLKDAMTFQK